MASVFLGSIAHHTDEALVVLTEELQGLLMLLTLLFPSRAFGHLPLLLQLEALGELHHAGQLPVRPEIPLASSSAAVRATEMPPGLIAALGDAGPAEVVPALDGDRVLEKLQADGTDGGFLEPLHGALRRSHAWRRLQSTDEAESLCLAAWESTKEMSASASKRCLIG